MDEDYIEDNYIEDKLNCSIELSISSNDLNSATDGCIKFLREIYGDDSIGIWALRDFYRERVLGKDKESKSRFDNNLERVMELREEKLLGRYRPKYESEHFRGSNLEKLDSLYERFKDYTPGRKGVVSFLKFIDEKIDEL